MEQLSRAAVVGLAIFVAGCNNATSVAGTCWSQLVEMGEARKPVVRNADKDISARSAGVLRNRWITYDGSIWVGSQNAEVIVESIHNGLAKSADSMLIAVDGVECNSENGEDTERIRTSCAVRRGKHDVHVRIGNSSLNHDHIDFCGKGYKFRIVKIEASAYIPGEEDLYPPTP